MIKIMKKFNIKKFENFGNVNWQSDSNVGISSQSDFSGNQRHLDAKEIKKLISENVEVQRKLILLDLDTRIDALQKLSEFNKEIFESNDNNKMEKFGKILDGVGLTTGLILSVVGAHQMATGTNATAILIGIICSAVISGIGLSIHKKSE
jgi:hypothetical protein